MPLRPARRWFLAMGALLCWASVGSSAYAQDRSPSEVAAEVRARGGYDDQVQHVSPSGGAPRSFPSGAGGGSPDDRLDGRRGDSKISRYERGESFEHIEPQEQSEGLNLSLPSAFGRGFGYLLMVIAAFGLLALIVVLVMTFWPKDAPLDPPAPAAKTLRQAMQAEVLPWNPGDPDELASAGRYAEAIVALLVRSLKASGWRENERARTAREVLKALAGHDARRPPLGQVVGRAEHVRFAGVSATRELYDEVRALADEVLHAQNVVSTSLPQPGAPS